MSVFRGPYDQLPTPAQNVQVLRSLHVVNGDEQPYSPGSFRPGDQVRVFAQGGDFENSLIMPDKCTVQMVQVRMTGNEFEQLQRDLVAPISQPATDPGREGELDILQARRWYIPFDPADNTDLDAAGQSFMAALVDDLLNSPNRFAVRRFAECNGIMWKAHDTGERYTWP